MITPEVPSFYVIRATGEAAELITSVFSPSTMADVLEVVVVSHEFSNDIEPLNEVAESLSLINEGLISTVKQTTEFNPLYVPSTAEQIDEAIDADVIGDVTKFIAMDGNPYAIASTKIETESGPLLTAVVRYNEFEIPSYDSVIKSCDELRIN